MKEVRYFYAPDASSAGELPADEATHALRVLRLQSGDEMFLLDGKGSVYKARVTMASGKHCCYDIEGKERQERSWRSDIRLAIAPTKMMERMEWLAEKATEIGFDELCFLDCNFSERKTLRVDRIGKIVVSAMKQSRKPFLPHVAGMCPFADFVAAAGSGHRFIAHCYDEIGRADLFEELKSIGDTEPVTVMIGPEGDFSIDEVRMAVNAGFVSVSLGKSRLRTETAGLQAVMMSQLVMRK